MIRNAELPFERGSSDLVEENVLMTLTPGLEEGEEIK